MGKHRFRLTKKDSCVGSTQDSRPFFIRIEKRRLVAYSSSNRVTHLPLWQAVSKIVVERFGEQFASGLPKLFSPLDTPEPSIGRDTLTLQDPLVDFQQVPAWIVVTNRLVGGTADEGDVRQTVGSPPPVF